MDKLTYQQKVKATPFNWLDFLETSKHSLDEMQKAKELAGNWPTCAVGNQCAVIPRDSDGEPVDNLLSVLGSEFYKHIKNWWFHNSIGNEVMTDMYRKNALEVFH